MGTQEQNPDDAAAAIPVPDILAPDLDVLFCGINPGLSSAAARMPFAAPSNRWWPALYASGFTPRILAPSEASDLLTWGLGLTALVRRGTARASELSREELAAGALEVVDRVRASRPRWLAVLGVTAYRSGFGEPAARVGEQQRTIGDTRVWVLPHPSGLNAHFPPRRLAEEFARLREAAGLPDLSVAARSGTSVD
jgi:double-stranded uracil-DNA glycosylase